jgi:hypothetical protein
MRATMLVISALVLGVPCAAQAPKPGAVTRTPDGQVEVTGVPCSSLMAGADYVPGVAADGSAVASVDLPHDPSPITADDAKIRIDSSLAGRFGVPASGGTTGAKSIYGYVTVQDGQAYFNGKKLAPDATAALADACRVTKK